MRKLVCRSLRAGSALKSGQLQQMNLLSIYMFRLTEG